MADVQLEIVKSLLSLVVSTSTLALGWWVGLRLTMRWNLRQKRQESDLAAAQDFHRLYGEFFAVWKLWNYARQMAPGDEKARDALLQRASTAEGGVESLLVRLSASRDLSKTDVAVLGSFRQGYQTLRQSIKSNSPIPWHSSGHREYVAFKRLATRVALILVSESSVSTEVAESRAEALVSITSNGWEGRWTEGWFQKPDALR